MTKNLRLFFMALIFGTGLPAFTQERSSSRIVSEGRGFLFGLPADISWVAEQNIIVVRPDPDDPDEKEIIASGKVKKTKSGGRALLIDPESMKKRPRPGDAVVLIGAPKVFPKLPTADSKKQMALQFEAQTKQERGHISMGFIRGSQTLKSTSESEVNAYKNLSGYAPQGFTFEWFLDFIPSLGVSLTSLGSGVPVKTYYRDLVEGAEQSMDFRVQYRRQLLEEDDRWRWIAQLGTKSEGFLHDNPDELVLSTQINLLGLGGVIMYEPGKRLLTDTRTRFQWTTASLSAFYSPSVTAQDQNVSRGESSGGSTYLELQAGLSWTMYWPWMPYVQRPYLSLDYVQQVYQLKFQGAPTTEAGRPGSVPEGGSYGENRSSIRLTLGFRFEDVVGRVFRPKD